jgi:hypothetical protein
VRTPQSVANLEDVCAGRKEGVRITDPGDPQLRVLPEHLGLHRFSIQLYRHVRRHLPGVGREGVVDAPGPEDAVPVAGNSAVMVSTASRRPLASTSKSAT